jgi:hypothetical protein
VLLGLLASGVLVYAALLYGLDRREPTDPASLRQAIQAGSDYLERHLGDSGRFDYVIHPDGKPVDEDAYNVLRHAGSLYGLGMAATVTDDAGTRQAILRGARYLLDHHVAPLTRLADGRAVWSRPGEEVRGRPVAKLGGAALGILGLLAAREVDPMLVPVGTLRELGAFLLYMQEADGHFVSKYDEISGYLRDFESVYYPGEASLALARLYEVDPDPRWLAAAFKAVAYLERKRRGVPVPKLPNDHWLLIAMGALVDRYDELGVAHPPIPKDRMLAHGKDIARSMLLEQDETGWYPGMRGAFDRNGRITPASTRVEGLIALHEALPEDDPFRAPLRRAIDRGVGFIQAGQLDAPPAAAGGFVAALPGRFSTVDPEATREVRIDYVQHALSAMVGLYRIKTGEGRDR